MYKRIIEYFQKIMDERLSRKLVKRLYSLPKSKWLSIGHAFNRWEFPMTFYDLLPSWWLNQPQRDRARRLIGPVCNVIRNEFGFKEELRYHNVHIGKMTNDEFEYWFSTRDSNKAMNDFFHKQSKVSKIQWWKDDVFKKITKPECIIEGHNDSLVALINKRDYREKRIR